MPAIPALPGRLSADAGSAGATAAVALRAIADWDIPELLIAHQDDPHLYTELGLAKPPSGAQLGAEVERDAAARAAGTRLALTIVEPDGEDCIGRVQTTAIDWEDSSATLIGWVAPRYRGRGLTAAALALATDWIQAACGLRQITTVAISDGAGDDLPPGPGGRQLQR